MNLVDQQHVAELAATVRHRAADVVIARDALRATAAAGQWQSPAARAFATSLQSALSLMQVADARAGGLADALDRHGQRAAHRARELAAVKTVAVPFLGSL